MSTITEIDQAVSTILHDRHSHGVAGAVYDRHGTYLGDAQHDSLRWGLEAGIYIAVYPHTTTTDVRRAVERADRTVTAR